MTKDTKNKNQKKYTIIAFFVFAFSLVYSFASASSVDLTTSSLNYKVGDTIQIRVQIKSDVSINAVSSKIYYSKDNISLSSISKSGSIISLWAQEPKFSNALGSAELEGVVLSGYTGNGGNIATLIFRANKEGQAEVKLSDVSILANDGNGTDVFSGSLSTVYLNIEKVAEVAIAENIPVKEKAKVIEKMKDSAINIEESKDKIVDVAQVAVEKVEEVEVSNNLPKYSFLVTIIILLLVILIFVIIFTFIFLMKIRKYFKDKFSKTEVIINKNFNNLEKDINSRIEHNSKESGKIIKEEIDISDEISKTKNEIIKEVVVVEKEF